MVVTVILINMGGNWVASKLDWLMMAYALASASLLCAVSRRPVGAKLSPHLSLRATPASATINNRRQVGSAGSATNAHQLRSSA